MESTDSNATSSPAPTATQTRRSGRVVKAPERLAVDAPAAGKRKRDAAQDDDDEENQAPDAEEEESDAQLEDDDDDEDVVEEAVPKRKRPSQGVKGKRPASKRSKTNGTAPAARQTAIPSRPKKAVRIDIERRDGDGLFGEIFASGDSTDDVAAHWYQRYQEDNAVAVTDLVNCILLAAGCDQLVTADDIRDPDNCQNRLADLQNVYADEGISDYPLIQRSKTTRSFRDLLVSFFKSLVNTMHETEVLYTDEFLMENIARWVATMSSSTLRPFRHTATTVALAMETALVEVAKKLDDRITKLTKQTETEKARRQKANKALLQNIQKDLDEATQNRSICQDQIKDFFDTVFVHRYRDIDSKIRTECVDALGSWIMHLPSVFLEPEYLRYLGWMLSDTVAQTRHEVLKQLARIFKRDADKIGSFIDRFRPRLVEMATRDIDVGVRVVAISVMETLKSTGMLEPTEIDSVCKLIFDSELRVRKAVVDFFADCINDAIEAKIEDMGGNDAIEDIFGDDEEDEYYAPRRDWVNIKCLAESLAAYDTQFEENAPTEPPRPLDIAVDMYNTPVVETRISVAAQVLYEKIAHIRNWEVLAGYLLHDHTVSAKASKKFNKGMALRNAVAPDGREEAIILEMLSSAVKQSLSHNADAHKKKSRTEISESPEDIALKLAGLIPKLLKKFGADPATAKIVLHLSRALDLDVFHQLRQDTQTCTQLLDEICTQFNRHVDRGVIHEASAALQETRQREELAELTDSKISVLWENVINSLRNFDKSGELSMRGDLDAELLNELANVLMKMSKLSSISECIDVLDAEGPTEESSSPAIEILIRVVHRGKIGDTNEELDDPEDEAVAYAIKVCFFYFMWQVRRLKEYIEAGSPIPQAQTDALNNRRKTYQMNLISTLSSRGGTDDLRLFATGALCDLHIIFGNLRSIVSQAPGGDESYQFLDVLYEEIPPNLVQAELIEIFESTERSFANRTKRTLAEPADDEDPIDDDDSDDEDEDELPPDEKKGRELKAEKQLCDLASKYVLAIALGMLDASGPQAGRLRKRMLRNASRLGANFRGVVEFLDEAKLRAKIAAAGEKAPAASGRNRGGKKPAGQQQKGNGNGKGKGKAISEEIIVDDDSSEEGEESQPEDEVEEGTEEDLRRRELLDDPMEEDEEEGPTPVPENVEAEEDSVLGD